MDKLKSELNDSDLVLTECERLADSVRDRLNMQPLLEPPSIANYIPATDAAAVRIFDTIEMLRYYNSFNLVSRDYPGHLCVNLKRIAEDIIIYLAAKRKEEANVEPIEDSKQFTPSEDEVRTRTSEEIRVD